MTSLSVAVAWLVGAIELLQVLAAKLELHGGFWTMLDALDLGRLGYVVVGLFAVTWLCPITLRRSPSFE